MVRLFARSGPVPAKDEQPPPDGAGPRRWRTAAARLGTALACLVVAFVLLAPTGTGGLTVGAFLRLPVEGLLAAAVVLALAPRARRVAAIVIGLLLGLLALVKIVDLGFGATLDRPFDPVLDWSFLDAAVVFLTHSVGRAGAIGAIVVAVIVAGAVLAGVVVSVLRLSRIVVGHPTVATRTVAALTVVWTACAVFGVSLAPGEPVAAHAYYDRLVQVRASLRDADTFAAELAVDAFRDTPADRLLGALRGKDVVVTFVESYGRVAVEDPALAPGVGAVLADGDRRLTAAGYGARSAFVTSPTAGGGSWLAHATFLAGLWVTNQHRYDALLASDRLTLTRAFQRAGWRTVGVLPGVVADWPEGAFFGYDRVYAAKDLGYRGRNYSFATMPDQYTLSAFERHERGVAGRGPLMADIPLVSSHAPWSPVPRPVDWAAVGDGSGFDADGVSGDPADVVLRRDRTRVLADYGRSIEYSLSTVVSYVERYGDDDLVLVFLGDHQPAPVVTGDGASRDAPITIVTRDRAVLDRIAGWDWHNGLKPGPGAPIWRMDTFRDRFLTAFA